MRKYRNDKAAVLVSLYLFFDVLWGEIDLPSLLRDDSWRPLAELTAGLYRLPWDMQYILLCFRFGVCNSVTVFCLLSEDPESMEHNWHILKSEGHITESYFTLSGNWRHGVSQAENGFNDPMVLGRRGEESWGSLARIRAETHSLYFSGFVTPVTHEGPSFQVTWIKSTRVHLALCQTFLTRSLPFFFIYHNHLF